MNQAPNTLRVNVVVELTAASLEAIVTNVKQIAGTDEKGIYRVDTADAVGETISRFLMEKDFESYARDISHYPR